MRWVLAVALVGVAIWFFVGRVDDEVQVPGATPDVPPDEKPPELITRRDATPPAPPPKKESPDPEVRPGEPDVPTVDFVVHGVVKKAGSDEVLTEAQVVALRRSFSRDGFLVTQDIATEDAGLGRFKLHVTDVKQVPHEWALKNDGWHVTRWQRDDDPEKRISAYDNRKRYDVTLWAYETFRVRGQVVDGNGQPIPGASVQHAVPGRMNSSGGISMESRRMTTDEDGRFETDPIAVNPEHVHPALKKASLRTHLHLTFSKQGLMTRIVDPFAIEPDLRRDLRVVLTRGATWSGVLVDASGAPLPAVVVEMRYGKQWRLRRGVRTDGDGRWRLERLSPGAATLIAHAYDHDATLRRDVEIDEQDVELRLVAEPLRVPAPAEVLDVFGLQLVQVDDAIRKAFNVPDYVHVLIWSTGEDFLRLNVGALKRGFGLWIVGDVRVKNIAHAVQLLNETNRKDGRHEHQGRIVYTFWDERGFGTNTQYLQLTDDDRARLGQLESEYKSRYPPAEKSD